MPRSPCCGEQYKRLVRKDNLLGARLGKEHWAAQAPTSSSPSAQSLSSHHQSVSLVEQEFKTLLSTDHKQHSERSRANHGVFPGVATYSGVMLE